MTLPRTGKLSIAVIALQLAVLAVMAGQREWIRAFGQTVYLRTAPIDPRSPLRGDYVRLRYDMSSLHERNIRGDVGELLEQEGRVVYAVLQDDGSGVYILDYLSAAEPQQGIFIKGRTTRDWRIMWNSRMGVKYGIEQYFVEQDMGKVIEEKQGGRGEIQIPMEVETALSQDGTAVVKDYRWSPVGVQLEVLRTNRRTGQNQFENPNLPHSPRVKIVLQNVSTEALTLVNNRDHCGFYLVAVAWTTQAYPAATDICDSFTVRPNDLITLEPEQTYTVEFELSEPRWHVTVDGEPAELGELQLEDMFRIVYRSPPPQLLSGMQVEAPLWRGEIASQAFNAVGRID